mmetsp:Transcript_117650/g.332844  ORF Transcript_117650/g.332844 Transcript_117650/m.332844 type:complete len:526 (-) Transcript_117650:121-1698(-)
MLTASICRCICGNGKTGDRLEQHLALGTPDLETLEEVDEPPFQPPQITGVLSYRVLPDQPLRGVPIREGELWYLSTEERVEPVRCSLYVNGFSFLHNECEFSISLSPFSLVRNCRFQSSYSSLNLSDFKIFKVSLFTQGICYYYGVRSQDERLAEEERSRWVLDISRAMRLVTQSLFPPFSISCDPLPTVVTTQARLMAGYLIHHDDVAVASVLYSELHPQGEGHAKIVLYENEMCQTVVMDIFLTDRSICCEKVGINCSCFCIEDHQFSTRTLSERKLWLRAISNVKVKLQNQAPSPSVEELGHYRMSIKEHISSIRGTLEGTPAMDALLQRDPRRTHAVDASPLLAPGCGAADVVSSPRAEKVAGDEGFGGVNASGARPEGHSPVVAVVPTPYADDRSSPFTTIVAIGAPGASAATKGGETARGDDTARGGDTARGSETTRAGDSARGSETTRYGENARGGETASGVEVVSPIPIGQYYLEQDRCETAAQDEFKEGADVSVRPHLGGADVQEKAADSTPQREF